MKLIIAPDAHAPVDIKSILAVIYVNSYGVYPAIVG
jgi:hypothetical protein